MKQFSLQSLLRWMTIAAVLCCVAKLWVINPNPNLHYGDAVKITSGFHTGRTGVVEDVWLVPLPWCLSIYEVEPDDDRFGLLWFFSFRLEDQTP